MIVCFCIHNIHLFSSFSSPSLFFNFIFSRQTHCQPYRCCLECLRSHSHYHAWREELWLGVGHWSWCHYLSTYPWTSTVPMTDIVLGTVMFGPKKCPSLRYTCDKSHHKTIGPLPSDLFWLYAFGSSAEATAADNRSLKIILKIENVVGFTIILTCLHESEIVRHTAVRCYSEVLLVTSWPL